MLRKSVLLLLQGLLTVQGYYVSDYVLEFCLGDIMLVNVWLLPVLGF